MAYTKMTWTDGQNKYNIKDQADTIINADIKIVYNGTGGTPVSATNMNNIENGIETAINYVETMALINAYGGLPYYN